MAKKMSRVPIQYIFKDDIVRLKNSKEADAQALGEAAAKVGWNADDFHEEARSLDHPAHKHLEWDDSVAAKKYRLDQIGELFRILYIDDPKISKEPVRAAYSIQFDDGRRYVTAKDVAKSEELQISLIRGALRDLKTFEIRYRSIVDVCKLVSEARAVLDTKLTEYESRASA